MTSKIKPYPYPEFSRKDGPAEPWVNYRRRTPQRALRIDGPFYVHTGASSGKTFCEDGYLLFDDATGNPNAMSKADFEWAFMPLDEPMAKNVEAGDDS